MLPQSNLHPYWSPRLFLGVSLKPVIERPTRLFLHETRQAYSTFGVKARVGGLYLCLSSARETAAPFVHAFSWDSDITTGVRRFMHLADSG